MIISDTHRLAFIHIPKCGGNSVRHYIQRLDETAGTFTSRTSEHPQLGVIDYAHIPLFILREHFASEYRKIRTYSAYTLVRDPFDRFPSSFAQYLGRFGPASIRELGIRELESELDKVISVLEAREEDGRYLPLEYIHFQRQSDFVFDRGRSIVRRVFGIHDMGRMLAAIGQEIGRNIMVSGSTDTVRMNETMLYRNEATRIIAYALESMNKKIMPKYLARRLDFRIKRWALVPIRRCALKAFESPRVRSFISGYYKDDIRLYSSVSGRAERPKELR